MPGSDVGNQGLSGLVMLIPSFVGPDPTRTPSVHRSTQDKG